MKSKTIIFHAAVFAILCLCSTIASCQKKGIRVRNLQETIALSERHYETIKDMSTASVDELIGIINVTEELEDSILSFTSRDTIAANKEIQKRIISVSDSLRFHIMRLALSIITPPSRMLLQPSRSMKSCWLMMIIGISQAGRSSRIS